MIKWQSKSAPQLLEGEIVSFYGGRFEIVVGAHSMKHWDAGVAVAIGKCLEGEISGYFSPGSEWRFQGNELSAFAVELV